MSQNEMLAQITKAIQTVPAKQGAVGVTAREYEQARSAAEGRPLGIRRARTELLELLNAGKIRCAGKGLRPSLSGDWKPIPVYSPVNGKGK